MNIIISSDADELGKQASKFVKIKINEAISRNGAARIVVSTGVSQFELFNYLIKEEIDWAKVEVFHLDEYIGLPVSHKASFRKYLKERFINLVPVRKFHAIEVEQSINDLLAGLTEEILRAPVDLGLIGIGVNGHIAFNDPPADFEIQKPFLVVTLAEKCRMQQVNEGWFDHIDNVPEKALTMSVSQIMRCRTIVSCVPHKVKAEAVYKTLTCKLTNQVPATMLKQHDDFHLYLDRNSASEAISF